MPVDPPIAAILALLGSAGGGSMSSQTVEDARNAFQLMTVTLRDPSTLASVRSVEDTTFPGPAGDIPIRIYRPDVDGPVPTMAFFHGGGFVIGTIESHDDHARLLCRDVGMVVVSVDYRLAPEHQFPAGYEDCLAATQWVSDNIADLGGDPERIAVGGDSAGGNFAAAIALTARDAGLKLAAQLLLYPAVDMSIDGDYPSRVDNAEGYFLTAEDMLWFAGQYLPADTDLTDPLVSPIRAESLAGVAPAVIATAEFDPLRDEDEAYAKALADAGVEVHLQRYDGMIHGFYGFGVHSPAAATAITELNKTLKSLLT